MTAAGFSFLIFLTSVIASPGFSSCLNFQTSNLSKRDLPDEIEEMSGLLISPEGLIHVQDSGNEPFLILTARDGTVLKTSRYAESVVDPEDLAEGPCPWGGTCVIVADTGDNFGWRSKRSLYAVDSATLWKDKAARSQKFDFTFPSGEKPDVEALAWTKEGLYLFTKEKKKSRVFTLPSGFWKEASLEARYVAEVPYKFVTGAAASADGQRILLINSKGAHELSKDESAAFYPKRRSIKIENLRQQEAIAYDSDQRSFVYSSERKKLKSDGWGIYQAACTDAKP